MPTSYTPLPFALSATLSLLAKTALGCAAYLSLALLARLLVEVLHTQWYPFETPRAARGQLLLHGLENPLPPLVHYLAMQDAVRVAEAYADRRRALFGADLADARAREAWKVYCTRCVSVLDALTAALRPAQDAAPAADPFADWQLQAWAARALAGMIVASKAEDTCVTLTRTTHKQHTLTLHLTPGPPDSCVGTVWCRARARLALHCSRLSIASSLWRRFCTPRPHRALRAHTPSAGPSHTNCRQRCGQRCTPSPQTFLSILAALHCLRLLHSSCRALYTSMNEPGL